MNSTQYSQGRSCFSPNAGRSDRSPSTHHWGYVSEQGQYPASNQRIPPLNRSRENYPVPKAPLIFILLLREEGADSCSCPAEDGDCEGNLYFIAWMDELGVVDSPEYSGELNQLLFTEQMLRLFLVHDQAFFGQGISGPLMKFVKALGTLDSTSACTYIVYRTSILLIDTVACHSSKSSEEPLHKRIH